MSTESESEESQPQVKRPEAELGLDLDLHFLPSWAQQSANVNQYAKYSGEEERGGGFRDRGDRRGPRRDGPNRGPRRDGDRGPRRDGPRGAGGPGGQGRPQGDRQGRGPRPGGPNRGPRPEQQPQVKLPDLEVSFIPEDRGVESLARQIKLSGRAYPLFEIAYLVLKKPERYHVQLSSKKNAEGQPAQPLYICGLDDTLWLDESEAVGHVLDKHFGTFYSTEKIPTDPPKGTYTFVAQCGISGTILGPPNYHDYQNKLRRLHQDRFARMPFDTFKSRIRIVKDEAVVKKWLEEQSFRTEFTALNIPDTVKFNTRDEVEQHFRQTHLANVVRAVDSYTIAGTAVTDLQNRPLHNLIRRSFDEQMRFPLKVVNILSGQFARQGLQFFKVNKSITHVAVARPHFLDMETTPVSPGVQRVVEFINSHPRATRKTLIQGLAPGAQVPATTAQAAPTEGQAATDGGTEAQPAAAPTEPPEVQAIISDLHWLIHQGHVIEFANGILETAKRPAPRPPKPAKAGKSETPAEGAAEGEVAASEESAAVEGGSVEGATTEGEASSAESEDAAPTTEASTASEIRDESGATAGAQVEPAQPAAESERPAGA